MDLNSILVSEFAKITNDNKETVNEGATVYGTYYSPEGGNPYVILDGSNVQTPISSTVEAHPGDRVTVLIKNHKAIVTGNLGDPSASTTTVKKIRNKLPEIEQIVKNISDTLLSDNVGYMELIKENIDGVEHLSGFRIMNTPTLTPDTKGWLANKNGIGWSSNGFETISKIGLDMENGRIYEVIYTRNRVDNHFSDIEAMLETIDYCCGCNHYKFVQNRRLYELRWANRIVGC